jgi:hypothetical protein
MLSDMHTYIFRPFRVTMLSIRKKADGISVQKLCPGVDYIITLRFPEPREFKISAAAGIWEALTGTWCVWAGADSN